MSLSKYLKSFEHHFNVLKQSGFEIATEDLRDSFMNELDSRGQDLTTLHRILDQ